MFRGKPSGRILIIIGIILAAFVIALIIIGLCNKTTVNNAFFSNLIQNIKYWFAYSLALWIFVFIPLRRLFGRWVVRFGFFASGILVALAYMIPAVSTYIIAAVIMILLFRFVLGKLF
ncbi:MAG: hypothetical protein K6E10_00190 [Eubacterium sp.]|nr:hypothetical protein [Eubacterium sp.]